MLIAFELLNRIEEGSIKYNGMKLCILGWVIKVHK
jgi:hypothetical protein